MPSKILTIVGTRPEAIKMAMLVRELKRDPAFDHRLCATAQHRSMLDSVLTYFEISPDYDLDLMTSGQTLAELTSRLLTGITAILVNFEPDLVLVHGDTSSCFVGALAAFYLRIPVGHVEAGLRTNDINSPFPEEANRVFVGRIATHHFAPTRRNYDALVAEGVNASNIIITGNTVIDALLYTNRNTTEFSSQITDPTLRGTFSPGRRIVLITGHRRENHGEGMLAICEAVRTLASRYTDVYFVYPVHLSPSVKAPVYALLSDVPNIVLTTPLDYPDFVHAMSRATIILTDSGGIQEEAPALGKPVLVMREETERPEAVEMGTVQLVGASAEAIIRGVSRLLDSESEYGKMANVVNPYGDGLAVQRILAYLKANLAAER